MEKKYTLPKEFGEKWVEALRTYPENKHHKGELQNVKDRACYCGIGVSCIANNIEISSNGMMMIIDGNKVDYYEGFIFKDKFANDFTRLNDQLGYTFIQLADWIESNVQFI